MSRISFPVIAGLLSLSLAAATLSAQTPTTPAPSPGMSKVRIVRLSVVRGTVQVEQGAGNAFEPAVVNLPVVESDCIRTGIGIAEVEFEDNSTLRLTPNTQVDFPVLERTASGDTVTEVRVVRGMAYVSLMKKRAGDFTLEFGPNNHLEKIQLPPSSHIRLQMNGTRAQLAVLGGAVPVNGASGPNDVRNKRTVSFTPADWDNPAVTKKVVAESFDAWDRQSAEYHGRLASLSAFRGAPYSYGMNDMAYYGAFSEFPGCGMMWFPYFAGASWNPYANGAWAWYQGVGYSWVSPYPWGWMPYHYGAWSYCPGAGWGWMPGGAWNGLNNAPIATAPGPRGGRTPRRFPQPPILPPHRGRPTMIAVNSTPRIFSGISKKGSFIFVRGSAGLGIPRRGLGGLRGFSRNSLRHGMATTPVYLSIESGARPGHAVAGNIAPIAVHRGYSPPPQMRGMGFPSGGRNNGGRAYTPDAGMSGRASSAPATWSGPSRNASGGGMPVDRAPAPAAGGAQPTVGGGHPH